MHLKYPYEIMELEGQSFAVALEGSDAVIKLNKTAAAIFELLKEDTNEEAIVEKLSQRFEVTKDTLRADVHRVVQVFREKGIME